MSHLYDMLSIRDGHELVTQLRLYVSDRGRIVAFKDKSMLKLAKALAVHGVKASDYKVQVRPGNFGTCGKGLTSSCFYCGNDWYVYAQPKDN